MHRTEYIYTQIKQLGFYQPEIQNPENTKYRSAQNTKYRSAQKKCREHRRNGEIERSEEIEKRNAIRLN